VPAFVRNTDRSCCVLALTMGSDSDVLTHFLSLDELIQVIYQGSSRFVVISGADDISWTVHVGLGGPEGRWWRGQLVEKDIQKAVGVKSSSRAVEIYVDRLGDAFTQGEMHIGNWSTQKGAQINFVLGTNTDSPVNVPLVELPPEEAAAFATKILTDIAIQAQSRKSRLHPSPFEQPSVLTSLPQKSSGSRDTAPTSGPSSADHKAEVEIKSLKAQLAKAQSKPPSTSTSGVKGNRKDDEDDRVTGSTRSGKTARPLRKVPSDTSKLQSIAKTGRGSATVAPRGASLANPTKKARKYEALEFGSDDD